MSRFLLLQDDTLSFEDMAQLKIGDVLYENAGYGVIIRVKVTSEPIVATEDDYTFVTFAGTTNFLDKGRGWGEDSQTDFRATKNLMHYGPKLMRDMYAWDRDHQCERSIDYYVEHLKAL